MRADASVIVLDLDDAPRRPIIPRSADPRRKFSIRPGPLLGIVIAHAAVVALGVAMPGERVPVPETESLVTVFIQPKIVVSRGPSVARPAIRVPRAAPLQNDVTIPEVARPTLEIVGVGTMAPRPADMSIDPAPFAQRAGLRAGDGATVVLRVEVLASGEIGRAEVEVSGGSDGIDRAAVAYARALAWIGGMVDGHPSTIWVRWGVRLQA